MMKKLVLGVALSALVFQAQAADNRYSTWSDPNKPQEQSTVNLDKMIKELRTMVDEAERWDNDDKCHKEFTHISGGW